MILRSITLCMVLLLVACATRQGGGTSDADAGTVWTADIAPVGSAGHGGRASAEAMGDGTHVTVFLTDGAEGGNHPWHVHEGVCESNGPIVGSAAMYPALQPDDAGNATAEAHINFPLDPAGSYYVNLHQSANDLGTIVGCGELRPGQGS